MFYNVAIVVLGQTGPSFVVRDIDLFNDTFQTTPFFRDDNFNTPLGDSTVVQVSASRGYKQGSMFYRLNGGAFHSVPPPLSAPALPTPFFSDVPPATFPGKKERQAHFSLTDTPNGDATHP